MPSFHSSVRRYSTVLEGAFENLKRWLIVVVTIPVSPSHVDFDADAFDELLNAIKAFSETDKSVTHIRMIYEMVHEEGLRRA